MSEIERADGGQRYDLKSMLAKSRVNLSIEDDALRCAEAEARGIADVELRSQALGEVAMRRARWKLDAIGLADVEKSL